ncbi:aldo/keto reductase [Streptomyces sp. NPDC059477]|uniref:aldo/keto reductase n=1 Tax=Streptomyces sp. NPDC059477 TaxID=3346847 RepID=UPI00367AB391
MGTYRTHGMVAAARSAIAQGVRWIDTAPNYQQGTAEQQLASVLAAHASVRVSTKVGFPGPVGRRQAVKAGIRTPCRTGVGYSLDPAFVRWQAEQSRAALGRTPDVTFVHNPEHGDPDPGELDARLLGAFRVLEDCCRQGVIRGYGVATWSSLHDGSLTVPRLLDLATRAGGAAHALKAIQLPLSLVHSGPMSDALKGRGVLCDAHEAGLEVFASAPLHGGELLEIVTPGVAELVSPGATPLDVVLGTVASSPGVTRVLLSASTAHHWADAARLIRVTRSGPLHSTEITRILDAFRS